MMHTFTYKGWIIHETIGQNGVADEIKVDSPNGRSFFWGRKIKSVLAAKQLITRTIAEQKKLTFEVQTYVGHSNPAPDKDYAEPPATITVDHAAEGMVIGLGGDFDAPKASLMIERRPGGWCIFIVPDHRGDASGYVSILDNGESYITPENLDGIETSDDFPAGLDNPSMTHCQNCGHEDSADNFAPTDGNPAPYVCPKCRSTDCF